MWPQQRPHRNRQSIHISIPVWYALCPSPEKNRVRGDVKGDLWKSRGQNGKVPRKHEHLTTRRIQMEIIFSKSREIDSWNMVVNKMFSERVSRFHSSKKKVFSTPKYSRSKIYYCENQSAPPRTESQECRRMAKEATLEHQNTITNAIYRGEKRIKSRSMTLDFLHNTFR